MGDNELMGVIQIKFDSDNPVSEAVVEIDNRTLSQHHVNPEDHYTQEEFALIALCDALGFEPAETLTFVK